jgi:hypothetical protein
MRRAKPLPLEKGDGQIKRGLLTIRQSTTIKDLDEFAVATLQGWKEIALQVLRDAGLPTTPEDNLYTRLLKNEPRVAVRSGAGRNKRTKGAPSSLGETTKERREPCEGAIKWEPPNWDETKWEAVRSTLKACNPGPFQQKPAFESLSRESAAAVLVDAINDVLRHKKVSRVDALQLAGAHYLFAMVCFEINEDAVAGQKSAADLARGPRSTQARADRCAQILRSAHERLLADAPIYKNENKSFGEIRAQLLRADPRS